MGDSSSGSDIEQFSGIEQPPLLQQLRTILDEYRNDVQIIKELVQNADDAEATSMKILYVGRTLNPETENEKKYKKFLRAPALVFQNDALFTDDDWRGIKSIYSSVKKDDPLKIGRFGLGFKSVFHLTDYPCVVSGKYVLFINPHERQAGRVCVTVKLKKLREWKRLDFRDFLNSMDGTFGFSERTIEEGHYQGTLFWFPLRQIPSELSENIYRPKDVYGLLQAFITESHRSLIFLKTLCSVEMFVDLSYDSEESLPAWNFGKEKPFYYVGIDTVTNDLIKKRRELLDELKEIDDRITDESKHWVHDAEVVTQSNSKDGDAKVSRTRWLILNFLKGGELSDRIQILKKDKDLLYPHLVALAAPIHEDKKYCSSAGHVFCYQPLPQESSSVTGLPVHVNAFFSLTQNRRHIRWPDEDDQTLATSDKKIEWNLLLLSEILPHAYFRLIQELVELSKHEENKDYSIEAVYNAIPDLKVVEKQWQNLAYDVLNICKDSNVAIFNSKRCKTWIRLDDVLVADARSFSKLSGSCFERAINVLVTDNTSVCLLPDHVTDAFRTVHPDMTLVTPLLLRKHLSKHDTYKSLKFEEKQDLLEFVLLDPSQENLVCLELVPRADRTFCRFTNSMPVYAETKDVIAIFPEHEGMFLSPDLRQEVSHLLQNIIDTGTNCIHRLTADGVKTILEEVVNTYFDSTLKIAGKDIDRWKNWLQQVWTFIQNRFRADYVVFSSLSIFPLFETHRWENAEEICLKSLQCHFLHRPHNPTDTEVDINIRQAFELLSVNVVSCIPDWIDLGFVGHFMHEDTSEGLLKIFSSIDDENIEKFNDKVTSTISDMFLEYLSERIHTSVDEGCKQKLRRLKIFKAYIDASDFTLCSLREKTPIYSKTFPVKFPTRVIALDSGFKERFGGKLEAEKMSEVTLTLEALKIYEKYAPEELRLLTRWVINNETVFMNKSVQDRLKEIPFLPTDDDRYRKPSDLFDPSDHLLKNLFSNQNMFPVIKEDDFAYINALRVLGLKTRTSLTTEDVEMQCNVVHQMSLNKTPFTESKCQALLDVMNERSNLVRKDAVAKLRCILAVDKENITQCPASSLLMLPTEVKSSEYSNLVGTVYHTIKTQTLENISDVFGWSKPPTVSDVVKHLFNIIHNYDIKQKAKTLQIVSEVYEWLDKQDQCSVESLRSIFQEMFSSSGNKYICVGDRFQSPQKVYVERKEDDIDLMPLRFALPSEMEDLFEFFISLGCSRNLDFDIYICTLEEVTKICEEQHTKKVCSDERLLKISIEILNKLRDSYTDKLETSEREIYFPVRCCTTNSAGLRFAPAKQCTYCDTEWLEDMIDDDINEIHPKVPHETAEALGVLSLRQQLLSNAEAFEEWGQEEPLTRRLRTLLKEGCVDMPRVARELFQNADDAGAKKFWILYDERENNDAKTHLLNENMAKCQGPAIWVYNDEKFNADDLKNITKLSGATKENDSTKIGKFGLGFCTVYELTDVPSFITGQNLVIFDPHTTFLGKALPGQRPGLRINFGLLKNVKMLTRMKNQFKPFDGIFGCKIFDGSPNFEGTLFRLPLRNCESDISGTVYTPSEIKILLNTIIDRSSNMLLFNQNVEEIKVFHLAKSQSNPENMKLLFEAKKTVSRVLPVSSPMSNHPVLVEASEMKKRKLYNPPLLRMDKNTITGTKYSDSQLPCKEPFTFSCIWLISWATGVSEKTLEMTETEKGAICLASVAVPIEQGQHFSNDNFQFELLPMGRTGSQFYNKGYVFFFLPLPIDHNFPFHVNAQFGVTSNRRHFNFSSENSNTKMNDWNRCLLTDPVVLALVFLLENVRLIGELCSYKFDQLWPRPGCDTGQLLKCVPESFYRHIVRPGKYKVFEKNGEWFDITQAVFLERIFRSSSIGTVALEALSLVTKHVIDVSDETYSLLKDADDSLIKELTVDEEMFFVKYFFPNLEYFGGNSELTTTRDELLSHAVLLGNVQIDEWIKKNPCIPSVLSGILKLPRKLVDPMSQIAELFGETDDVFPANTFQSYNILYRLRNFGLIQQILPDDFVLERAKSVPILNDSCEICAALRSSLLVLYLSRNLSEHENCIQELKHIPFIPVMSKPHRWPFTWKRERSGTKDDCKMCKEHIDSGRKIRVSRLECARNMYNSDCKYLVGCIDFIFDNSIYLRNPQYDAEKVNSFLKLLEMKGIPKSSAHHLSIVIEQFDHISNKTLRKTMEPEVETALKEIYCYLDINCRDPSKCDIIRMNLEDKRSVWTGDQYVDAKFVAKMCRTNCQPYLFDLKQTLINEFRELCKCLNIVDNFKPRFICEIITKIKEAKKDAALTAEEVQSVINILYCLKDSLTACKMYDVEKIFDEEVTCIYAPDEHCVLRNCKAMCLNDSYDIEKTESMIFAHGNIPGRLAKVLGIRPKVIYNLQESSEDIIDFYQEEPLVVRLRRLVEGYPSVSDIFKELIQNADDAHATEIHILLDENSHPCNNIMNDEFAPLQGPALCVYNNSAFSNEDLKGIQSLGVGNKGEDSSKTGRYGVGFNSVYNITDAPSFYTKGGDIENGETLCFFDPMAKFLPDVKRQRPGKRIKNLQVLRRCHSNVLEGYHIDYFSKSQGGKMSIFRFPLRTQVMAETSEIKTEPVDIDTIKSHLDEFMAEAKEMLIFLKHLRTIRISNILQSGRPYEYFRINVEMKHADMVKRRELVDAQSELCSKAAKDKKQLLTYSQRSFVYEMSIREQDRISGRTSKYTIVQTLGFKNQDGISEILKHNLLKGNIGLVPHGGVAHPSSICLVPTDCKAFCFLPLPISTGLPVHVHGYFALDHEIRRNLFKGEDSSKSLWNLALMEQVISPAYVLLLEQVKLKKFPEISKETSPLSPIMTFVTKFQQLFPNLVSVTDENWKALLTFVFRELVSEQIPFLPSMRTSISQGTEKMTGLSWTPLRQRDCEYPAYCRNESDCQEKDNCVSDFNNLLRDLGLRIVFCDKNIKASLKYSGVAIEDLKPKHLTVYLTSFNSSKPGKCLIEVNKTIQATVLKSPENLSQILNFCIEDLDCFTSNIQNIPLFLTQDSVVRLLPDETHFFLESSGTFCDMFPTKVHLFLYSDVCRLLSQRIENYESRSGNKLKKYDLQDFLNLANETNTVRTGSSTKEEWDKNNPSADWVTKFWRFFAEQTPNKRKETVARNLEVIDTVAIIPATICQGNTFLVPPTNRKWLLHTESFAKNMKLHQAILKFKLPTLDRSVVHGEILTMLVNQIPSFERASDVVENFHLHLKAISKSGILGGEACCVVRYFSEYMKAETLTVQLKEKLRQIPLFLSRFGSVVALSDFTQICVVPNDLPDDGLAEIAKKAGVLFLEDIGCCDLFQLLDIQTLKLAEVYTKHIIPNQEKMAREDFYKHVKFIADESLPDGQLSKADFLKNMLKDTKFVRTEEGTMVHIKDLFSPFYQIFRLMCKPTELVPQKLQDNRILSLFKQLGMKTSMNLELFERFGEDLHLTAIECGLSKDVQNKSSLLLKALFKMKEGFFKTKSFEKLCELRFVPPLAPSSEMTCIHRAFSRNQLICFRGSIVSAKLNTCWTVANVLFPTADPTVQLAVNSDLVVQKLKIKKKTPLSDLIHHFENIGQSVREKEKLPDTIKHDKVSEIMKDIYQSLDEYRLEDELKTEDLASLSGKPTIYVPNTQQILPASLVAIDCPDDEQIQPYLNKCPDEYSEYKDLFLVLGARKKLSCDEFAFVLQALTKECDESERLLPKTKADGVKAMGSFFNFLTQSASEVSITTDDLYLLSNDFVLKKSSTLVAVNDSVLHKTISENYTGGKVWFLLEPKCLGNYKFNKETFVESLFNLPDHFRPRLLTDVVKARIVLDDIQLKDNAPAEDMGRFIHSRYFFSGFVRLVRHALKENGETWSGEEEERIAAHLENISFRHACGIKTLLALKENSDENSEVIVNNSQEMKHVHLEISGENVCVYFDTEHNGWLGDVQTELSIHLNEFVHKCFKGKLLMTLREIIGLRDRPSQVGVILSKTKIPEYESDIPIEDTPVVPVPGTYVPKDLHHFLDNDYGLFYHYEYKFVALEIDDPAMDTDCDEPVGAECGESNDGDTDIFSTYIFVHIIEKVEHDNQLPLLQEYKIDDGSGTPRVVKAFQLFKFIMKINVKANKDKQLMAYDGTFSENNLSNRQQSLTLKEAYAEVRKVLKEAWKQAEDIRKRIVKRLLLKWHPDKNPENVTFCTKVFQYIQHCLQRLEKNLDLPEDPSDASTSTTSESSSASSHFNSSQYGQYWRRYRRRRKYWDNSSSGYSWTDFSSRSDWWYGGWNNSNDRGRRTRPEPYHYFSEGRRWQKQAKSDILNSRASLQAKRQGLGHTCDWICYMAHQAAENSLIAAWYCKDANHISIIKSSHDLIRIAEGLGSDLLHLARGLSSLVGDHSRMRYPDRLCGELIPAEAYTRQTAETAIQLAQEIIDKVQDNFIR